MAVPSPIFTRRRCSAFVITTRDFGERVQKHTVFVNVTGVT